MSENWPADLPAVFADDLRADGEPEPEFDIGIARRLPRKRAAGGALIRDGQGRILFVDPSYKPYLDIPGGVANANESPLAACRREIQEEIGINIEVGRLLVVDWVPEHGAWRDGLLFVFDGGVVSDEEIAAIKLCDEEHSSFSFLAIEDALPHLRPSMGRRMLRALDSLELGFPLYTEFGRTEAEGGNAAARAG
jgi:ADP-ribose pyrophosphatase YjhB (NUDIX family)